MLFKVLGRLSSHPETNLPSKKPRQGVILDTILQRFFVMNEKEVKQRIRQVREELNIPAGQLAEQMGGSRRALWGFLQVISSKELITLFL